MLAYAYRLAQGSGKSFRPNTSSRLSGVPMTATIRCGLKERRLLKISSGNRGLWLIRQMGLAGEECGITDSWDTATGERKEMLARFRQQGFCRSP